MFANIEEPLLLYRVHGKNISYVNSKETAINGILIDYELIKNLFKRKIDIKIIECLWFSNYSNIEEVIKSIELIIVLLIYHTNQFGRSLIVASDAFRRISSICLDNKQIIEKAKSSDVKKISQLLFNFYSVFDDDQLLLNRSISTLFYYMSSFSLKKKSKN